MKYKKVRALPYLKELLKGERIQQKKIAEETGLTTMTIWKIVNRKAGSPKTARLISDYLNVNQAELFEVIRWKK